MFAIENAKEIMFLCFGGGFLIISIYLVRNLIILNRLLNKFDDLSDVFIEYIQKPLSVILQINKAVKTFSNWFKKK